MVARLYAGEDERHRMKLFVGTNFGHGAAVAALNEDGDLVFAAEEGRLIGIKDYDQFPVVALHELLRSYPAAALEWAEGWHRWKRFANKGLATTLKYGFSDRSYLRSRLTKEISRLYAGFRA